MKPGPHVEYRSGGETVGKRNGKWKEHGAGADLQSQKILTTSQAGRKQPILLQKGHVEETGRGKHQVQGSLLKTKT